MAVSRPACPLPFLDASLYPSDFGYVAGRLCASIPLLGQKPGATCCLPCPVQKYALHPGTLSALYANDLVNIIGIGVGAFVLLVCNLGNCFDGSHSCFCHRR